MIFEDFAVLVRVITMRDSDMAFCVSKETWEPCTLDLVGAIDSSVVECIIVGVILLGESAVLVDSMTINDSDISVCMISTLSGVELESTEIVVSLAWFTDGARGAAEPDSATVCVISTLVGISVIGKNSLVVERRCTGDV